jgi:hypothetical protein
MIFTIIKRSLIDIFDLSTHASDPDSSLATALRSKLGATKELLTSLVQRGAAPLLQDQVFLTAQAAQAEVRRVGRGAGPGPG